MTRPAITSISLLVVAGLTTAADSPVLPRYKFEPGQELTYRVISTFTSGQKRATHERRRRADWTVWVVRANADGSFRLVIRQEDSSEHVVGGKKLETPSQSQLLSVDVFPDGRFLPSDTIRHQTHPGRIFPKLPGNATEAIAGWSWKQQDDGLTAMPVKVDRGFRFETVTESPLNAIYLSSSKTTYNLDPEKGRITSAEIVSTQGYGINGKWTGKLELVGVKAIEPTLLKQLAAEEQGFFTSAVAYQKQMQAAVAMAPEEARKRTEMALSSFKAANTALSHPVLKAELATLVQQHGFLTRDTIAEAGRRSKIVGKPAPPFETKDLDGKTIKLADLKGKVVVLDFWYRGCGWCVRAMPQMNALVEDFAGEPVAILGMNTDSKEEDARFVIEKMGLKYPTLKAIGLPGKFGVEGFPTLIVIDRQGKVHDLHVGYSPTLREEVSRQIKALLAKK